MKKASSEIEGFYQWNFTDIVKHLPESVKMIEIGSYVGKSAVAWAEAFEQAGKEYTIHCVDTFQGITDKGRTTVMNEELKKFLDSLMCTGEEQEQRFIENTKGWDNITYEKSYFTDEWRPKEDYDVLWYDANHFEESVTEAINFWENRVDTMIIDCYDDVHPGTVAAIDKSNMPFKLFEYQLGTKGIALIDSFTSLV